MALTIALLPGDGIGPEVTAEAVRLLTRVGELYHHSFRFSTHPIGRRGDRSHRSAAAEGYARRLPGR